MIFYFIAGLYLLIIIYIARRTLGWFKAISSIFNKKWLCAIYYVLFIIVVGGLPFLSFIIPKTTSGILIKRISNYWLGAFIYTLLVIVIIDILRGLGRLTKIISKEFVQSRKVKIITGVVAIVVISSTCIYGAYHARQLQTKNYEIQVNKTVSDMDELTVVLVSDTHMGYNIGISQMEEIIQKVNEMDADIVCFAGDVFDNDYEAVEDPDRMIELYKSIKSKYGVYACFGNHDVDFEILSGFQVTEKRSQTDNNRMVQFLEKAGVILLRDESLLINNRFYIVGRLDARPIGVEGATRRTAELLLSDLNKDKPIIVMDHQPVDLDALRQNGADIVLSGHTHNGQLFPGNVLIKFLNKNSYGYLHDGSMNSIVTSGAGLWGPYMRVGTDCEVVKIKIKFQS